MAVESLLSSLYALAAAYLVISTVRWRSDPLKAIPTVGGSDLPILSVFAAFKYLFNGKDLITEGYRRFHGKAFKIALLDQWTVVVSGPKMVDELRKRPDEELSFIEGTEEFLQMKYTLGRASLDDPYHVDIIREKLMRTLPVVLPDVIDELTVAVPDYVPTNGNEWTTVDAMPTMQKIVARASNRVFVGIPLCRNQKYLDLAIQFTMDVVKDRTILIFFPHFLRPLVGALISGAKKNVTITAGYLKSMLDERRSKLEEFGDSWEGRPNDMLQWVLEESIPRRATDEGVAERILLVNFAAIHTSSNSITHALYDLGANPELLKPLRDEIEPIVAVDGWTKAAMGKMWKLDSFLKESQRFHGIGLTSVTRLALKDITFSDGTFVPAGTLLSAATWATHHDDSVYPDAEVFDPFRFARMRDAAGEGTKHQFVNTSLEYIPFGHGKHACPGRFFAANELKAMLAFMVVHYDIKLAGNGSRPSNIFFGSSVVPSSSGKLMFRKRQVV